MSACVRWLRQRGRHVLAKGGTTADWPSADDGHPARRSWPAPRGVLRRGASLTRAAVLAGGIAAPPTGLLAATFRPSSMSARRRPCAPARCPRGSARLRAAARHRAARRRAAFRAIRLPRALWEECRPASWPAGPSRDPGGPASQRPGVLRGCQQPASTPQATRGPPAAGPGRLSTGLAIWQQSPRPTQPRGAGRMPAAGLLV